MNPVGLIHPAILIALAVLILLLSAVILFRRRDPAAAALWLSSFGQAIRRMAGKRPNRRALTSVMRKRRWLLACVALAVIGLATWSLIRDANPEERIVTVLATSDAAADTTDAEGSLEIEVDLHQLARQEAHAQRIKQGMGLLVAIGVIAVVWATASKFAAAD